MIASIKSEWRKNRFRPAFLLGGGLMAALTTLVYSTNWYIATHPGSADQPLPISTLYPDHFVNNVMGAGFPLGAAMAIVLGAILVGSEYSWSTMKTLFTQGPGRLTTWVGRVVVFAAWMAILTAILFVVGGVYSGVIGLANNASITWPSAEATIKGFGAIWLIFTVNGAIGMALGVLVRQSAAAVGIGIVYLLSVEVIAVRFIDGLSNGTYRWIGDLFAGQNANALIGHLAGSLPKGVDISAGHAVIVMFAWLVAMLVVAAGLQRVRDVT